MSTTVVEASLFEYLIDDLEKFRCSDDFGFAYAFLLD